MTKVSAFVFSNELIQCGAYNPLIATEMPFPADGDDRDDNDPVFDFGPLSRSEMKAIVEEMMG